MIAYVSFADRPQQHNTYGLGEYVVPAVGFTEAISVEGQPTLVMEVGDESREAEYFPGSRSNRWIAFRYRVQADDVDRNGISIRSDGLRLNGGRIYDTHGNDVPPSLEGFEVSDHPLHLVDGSFMSFPTIEYVRIRSLPPRGDTYRVGDTIEVRIQFNDFVRFEVPQGHYPFEMTFHIGSEEVQVAGRTRFVYEVRAGDYDPDGISIPEGALRHIAGVVRGVGGQEISDFSLGRHAVMNDPRHKVDGGRPLPVPTVPASGILGMILALYGAGCMAYHGLGDVVRRKFGGRRPGR